MIASPSKPAAARCAAGALIAVATLLTTACTTRSAPSDSFLGVITPYRIDIVQGSVVTKEQAAAVRPGMSREQVRDILGSPMLTDPFHATRWDYVFTIRRQGAEPQRRSVIAHFNGNQLERLVVPDGLPTEVEFVAAIAPAKRKPEPRGLELSEEQRKALPAPAKAEASLAPAPAGAVRTYPPLERQ